MKISLSLPARAKNPRKSASAKASRTIAPEERHRMIADAAFFRAERRGFEEGFELQDWIEAEAEVDAMLARQSGAGLQTGGGAEDATTPARPGCPPPSRRG